MFYETIGTESSEWAGKPYAEIRQTAEADGSILVVPVGSIEQHGHHLPVATDTILVDAVAHGGAGETDDVPVVVTPPVWCGFSPHHLSFGGTLSLDFEQLQAVLEDIAATGLENGFDAVLFINGHGGNISLINSVVSTVGRRHEEEILGMTYFQLLTEEITSIRDSEEGGMAHGGEFETSLMLHLRPDLVVTGEDVESTMWDEHYEWGGEDLLSGGPLSVYRPFEEYSESGAIGAPEQASDRKGEQIYERITEEFAVILTAVHEHNRMEST